MSGASGGVVYAAGTGATSAATSRFGVAIALGANAVIPAGAWYVPGPFTVTPPTGAAFTVPGGYCISDGVNVNMTAAASILPIGA